MQKINLNDKIIENITRNYNNLQSGGFGTVAQIDKDLAIKFYGGFLTGYKEKNIDEISKETTIYVPQINVLTKKQKDIKLTTLPLGVAYYQDVPVGVIIKYFEKHNTLFELYKENDDVIINILQNVLESIKELLINGIFQTDIKEDNFLYSTTDYKAQAIDLDGMKIDIGRENIWLEEMIYESLLKMFIYLANKRLLFKYNNGEIEKDDYETKVKSVKSLDYNIYIYESLQLFINTIKNKKILESKQKILKK